MFEKLVNTEHWKVSGIVEAPADEVFKLMLELHRQASKELLYLKNGGAVPGDENTHFFEVNASARTISIRGGFWYEGVFSVIKKKQFSQVTYRVNNIGPKSHILPRISKWLVPLWQYKTPVKMKLEMKGYLENIGNRLGCKTYLEE